MYISLAARHTKKKKTQSENDEICYYLLLQSADLSCCCCSRVFTLPLSHSPFLLVFFSLFLVVHSILSDALSVLFGWLWLKKTKRENHFRSLENHRNKFELIKLKSFHFSFCCFNCCCHYIGCRWCRARQYIVASLHAKNTSCSVYFMCTYLYSSISFTLHPILFTLFTLPFLFGLSRCRFSRIRSSLRYTVTLNKR